MGRRSDGSSFPIELTLTEADLGERALVAVARDITERKRVEEKLRHLADFDALTGLLNRRRFEQELDKHIAYSARYGTGGSVLVVDLDNFKYVNDTLGSRAGDELLFAVAGLLRGRLRKTDVLARLGGDEFGMLLHGAEAAKVQQVAEDLLGLIANNPFVIERQSLRATVSVGVATIGDEEHQRLRADRARRPRQVHAPRRPAATASPTSTRTATPRVDSARVWSDRVREAIEQGRFVLHAQPILDLASNQVSQYELLIRMRGDGRRAGAARRLPRHRRALQPDPGAGPLGGPAGDPPGRVPQARRQRPRARGQPVGQDPRRPGLRDRDRPRDGPRRDRALEPDLRGDRDRGRRRHRAGAQLRREPDAMGCRFALDDFGSGFASFYYLKHLPISILKIDGEFVKDLPRTPNDQLIVKALVEVAEGMGMKTVGEFVEDDATLEILRQLGVTYAQGFHIGRPGPVGELAA